MGKVTQASDSSHSCMESDQKRQRSHLGPSVPSGGVAERHAPRVQTLVRGRQPLFGAITNVSVTDRKRQASGPSLASDGPQLCSSKPPYDPSSNHVNVTG